MSRPVGSYGDFSMRFYDAGNEFTSMKGVAKLVMEDGSNAEDQLALFGTLRAAVIAVVLGDYVGSSYISTQETAYARPTNGANRETKLLVQYKNVASGKRFTLTIPTIDPTIPVYIDNINAKDVVSMSTPASIVTLINALNAFIIDPQSPGNPTAGTYAYGDPTCEVIGLQVVGRNI